MISKHYDPPAELPYVTLLSRLVQIYRSVESHEELEQEIGTDRLTDMSDHPDIRRMDSLDPLPEGFVQRTYLFRDRSNGRGILDVVFHERAIVNIRAQLFTDGWFAKSKSKRLLSEDILPNLEIMFGPPVETGSNHSMFKGRGLVVAARLVPGRPSSVSMYLVDKEYSGR